MDSHGQFWLFVLNHISSIQKAISWHIGKTWTFYYISCVAISLNLFIDVWNINFQTFKIALKRLSSVQTALTECYSKSHLSLLSNFIHTKFEFCLKFEWNVIFECKSLLKSSTQCLCIRPLDFWLNSRFKINLKFYAYQIWAS